MRKILVIILWLSNLVSNGQVINASPAYKAPVSVSTLISGNVAYYKFDESSGSITDYSGNSNTGTATSVTYSATGIINTALSFNGTSSYVDMGNTSSLSLTSTGSISAWIYCNSVSVYNIIVGKQDCTAGLNGYTFFVQDDGSLRLLLGDGSSFIDAVTSPSAVSATTWHHVVATWDGTYLNLYLDGSNIVSNVSQTLTPVSNVWNFYVGAQSDNLTVHLFNGKIDEVAIYNRALSSSEVTTLYSSGSGDGYPFSFLIIPMKYLGKPYQSDPIGIVFPIEKYFADLPKNKVA